MAISRRKFIELAGAFGATLALRSRYVHASNVASTERRDLFPQGVASGDPHADSVILWTRRPPVGESAAEKLKVEISRDPNFSSVVSTATAKISAQTDWTCRVLAVGLKPRTIYWFRFTDEHAFSSRVGRTITAPSLNDDRPLSFTFVSCQMVPAGACNAYRRMIWEDEQKPLADQLGFVLHLGDFIYEVVWYPEDRPQYYARKLRDVIRYPQGEKIRDFHVPVTVEDYRALYRGYLSDPDLQDARARWPFVCMWDNHEFSWKGWQSQQDFSGVRPAQTRKVAANQAWFEYQPARVIKPDPDLNSFAVPPVKDAPLTTLDDHGLGLEAGNQAAINSLKLYRALRFGKNVDLILTDNRSFRSEPVLQRKEAAVFQPQDFPYVYLEKAVDVLDAGRTYNNGKPPDAIKVNEAQVLNFRKHDPPQSMLGREQKRWFLQRLRQSSAPWKLWGNSIGMLDWRLDFQNLPAGVGAKWPDDGYATFMIDDWAGYRHERAEILDYIRSHRVTGVAAICGDRHAFEAGLVSASATRDPVIPEFITGSISAPGLFEGAEFSLAKDHPLRAVYLYQPPTGGSVQPAINFSLLHGVRAGLELQRTGAVTRALTARNPELAPHLSFVDLGGHGYALVRAEQDHLEVEFVCIPRPLQRSQAADGGPVTYRVTHRVDRWLPNTPPKLLRTKEVGILPLVK
ncbi:MAG TPA: alkaline phosphatase D family protein [Pyrinomonadaceae bacterium]|nr:alkaline phosphatase D family protein [Pyrinomonadaceae bacterium]